MPAVRPVVQHVVRELAPAQFGDELVRARTAPAACRFQRQACADLAEMQVGGQARGALNARAVAVVRIGLHPADERLQSLQRTGFAWGPSAPETRIPRRTRRFDPGLVPCHALGQREARQVVRRSARPISPRGQCGLEEGREHAVGRIGLAAHEIGIGQQAPAAAAQRHAPACQRGGQPGIAGIAVRFVQRTDVDGGRAAGRRQCRQQDVGIAFQHMQPAAQAFDPGGERRQRLAQPGTARVVASAGALVDVDQQQGIVRPAGALERGVVGEAQVAAEPEDPPAHPAPARWRSWFTACVRRAAPCAASTCRSRAP